MTYCKASAVLMGTFLDFVTWAGSQRRAAELIDLSESMVSLILSGKRNLQPDHAIKVERVTAGLYRADDLLPEMRFTRNEAGEVTGWNVKANGETPQQAASNG